MFISDDTTTVESTDLDFDEDKTLVLNGADRLKFFSDDAQQVLQPVNNSPKPWFGVLNNLFS